MPGYLAYLIRMSALGRSGSIGAGGGVPGRRGRPGPRSAGAGTRSAFFSRGTWVKRQGEPGCASHFGQARCSTSSASDRAVGEGC